MSDTEITESGKKRSGWSKFCRLVFIKIPLWFIAITVLWVLVLKWCPVICTPLMVQRSCQFMGDKDYKTHYKWVPIEKISPEMMKAVISNEDNLFAKHHGFSFSAMKQAREEYLSGKRKYLRGASTISQQTAKNVFLLPVHSFIRKGFEAYFTVLIEVIWGKERIMEVYLNVIEMGKGIYGAEAAAEHYWGTSAAKLTNRQACLIAAAVPSPLKRDPGHPSSYLNSSANRISNLERKLAYPDWVYHKIKSGKTSKKSKK